MKQKKMLALTPSQLKQLYRHELPELTGIRRPKPEMHRLSKHICRSIWRDIPKRKVRPAS